MKEFTCIVCPRSCRVRVEEQAGELLIEGHQCKRGEAYAREEYTNPLRVLTSTVALSKAPLPLLPVRTAKPVPKGMLKKCMEEINTVVVEAPVRAGQVIVRNLASTGVDLVATRSIGRRPGA